MSIRRTRLLGASLAAAALAAGYLAQGTYAAGTPANKVAASGSETEVFGPGARVLLLSETVKINNPTDLILSASAECSIVTQVRTDTDNRVQTAAASIRMWIEINGRPVPVSEADADAGRVVFCDRVHQQETEVFGDEDDENDNYVRTYLSTRSANSFEWLALNVGTQYGGTNNNIHKIELYATLVQAGVEGPQETYSRAIVGNRTLVLEPVKAAVGERVVEVG